MLEETSTKILIQKKNVSEPIKSYQNKTRIIVIYQYVHELFWSLACFFCLLSI